MKNLYETAKLKMGIHQNLNLSKSNLDHIILSIKEKDEQASLNRIWKLFVVYVVYTPGSFWPLIYLEYKKLVVNIPI